MTSMFPELCIVAKESISNIICKSNTQKIDSISDLITDIILYKKAQIQDIFINKEYVEYKFNYDIFSFANLNKIKSVNELCSLKFTNARIVRFEHSPEQVKIINSYVRLFGSDIKGVARILGRVFLKQLFRNHVCNTSTN